MAERYTLWEHLAQTDKPIFLYGTGNGGDKIIAALEQYGVTLTGVFASDGFVRNRTFHTWKVQSYTDVTAAYGDDIIVLLAFGTTLPAVWAFLEQLQTRHELIIPEVPLYGGELFDMAYYRAHELIFDETENLFADEDSRLLFRDAIQFRLTGKLEYLRRTEEMADTLRSLTGHKQYHTILDGGAFKGDSTAVFASVLRPEKILAVEADPKTFVKLSAYAEKETKARILPIHAALWDTDGTLPYVSSGSRGAGKDGKNHRADQKTVPCRSLDSLLKDQAVDFIKLDIEGAEGRALDGAESILKDCQPDMAVSLYHRTDDLYALVQRIHAILPQHRLYLRRVPCIPLWDITLYAVR